MTRLTGRVAAALALTLLAAGPAPLAHAEDYAGDLRATKVDVVDANAAPVSAIRRGQEVSVRFTITNTEKFIVKVTGVDSQASLNRCSADFKRASHDTNPLAQFPIYLKPGEQTAVLLDEGFTLLGSSHCDTAVLKQWKGNVIAEKVSAVPVPTPAPLPTGAPVPTSSLPTAPAPTTTEAHRVTPRVPQGFDWTPVIAVGLGTAVLFGLLVGLLKLVNRRR